MGLYWQCDTNGDDESCDGPGTLSGLLRHQTRAVSESIRTMQVHLAARCVGSPGDVEPIFGIQPRCGLNMQHGEA